MFLKTRSHMNFSVGENEFSDKSLGTAHFSLSIVIERILFKFTFVILYIVIAIILF